MNAPGTMPSRQVVTTSFQRKRLWVIGVCLAFLTALFSSNLFALMTYAAGSDLHSHILLVPLVSAYLLRIRWATLPKDYTSSPGLAAASGVVGGFAYIAGSIQANPANAYAESNGLALIALSFLCFVVAVGFLVFGVSWMASAAFPVGFLVFLVPLPDGWVHGLETVLMHASADAAALFFSITGLPILRDGLLLHLPGITLEVAQECSGIRSSWILFITSLVVSGVFLRSPWRRTALVAFVIPLAILRNGFRILVIGWLCVRVGPEMISSVVHRRGGPLFFGLSLVLLFALLWWLRRGEMRLAKEPLGRPVA